MGGPTEKRDPTIFGHRIPLASDGHSRTPTVVVGVDGTKTSWGAFWWACGEARRLGGRVIAVYVSPGAVKTLSAGAAIGGFDAGGYAAAVRRSHEEQADRLRAEIDVRAVDLGIEISFLHRQGDPAQQLKAVARDTRADLIAVGRSVKLRHHLLRSLGRRLTRDRSAPIVVIVP